MKPINSKLEAFFEDALAYEKNFSFSRYSKFQKNFQIYLTHTLSSYPGMPNFVETCILNIGQYIKIEKYNNVSLFKKTEIGYHLKIGNKPVKWADCPEKTMNTIQEKINNFRNFVKYSGCNNLEKLNIDHVMQNINLYCDMACESNENQMFSLLFDMEDKKINKKLLSLVEIMPEKMKEERVKKLNSFSLLNKLDNNLIEETVKSTKMKL